MSYEPSLDDRRDYDAAERGFIAALVPGVITNDAGKVVWDIDEYAFVQGACPPTAHPYLWRQAQLNAKQGLFEVVPGIYQVRALDLSNMTIVEGDKGILVIDPLVSCECAAAGLRLYQAHRGGHRPVTGMVYSHSHGDHYMGARGVLEASNSATAAAAGGIPIIAPEGFLEAILSESVLAGPAMRKRGAFMYGNALPRGPRGQIGVGLGMGSSVGSTSLVPPNVLVQKTGETHVVDGVRLVFQMVPGTEAPAEVNFYLPDFAALCVPETATNCMHNIVTLRGAQVRDAKAWSGYLDEAITLFGGVARVVFGSHNWPTWGQKELCLRLAEQRDMYGYLHDQTVRMMNLGMTGTEIAERIQLPPAISSAWHCRGFYGSVSHNVKGIYQKYMTWFDGHPAHLWQYPPAEEGQRYVECMGGVETICEKAQDFIRRGDSRFAATLLAHAVAAHPDHPQAKALLATAYEALGFGAENATWRNFYLTGAQELRTGDKAGVIAGGKSALGDQLTIGQWFDVLSVQLDGDKAAQRSRSLAVDFEVTDVGEKWRVLVSNGVLIRRLVRSPSQPASLGAPPEEPDFAAVLRRQQLLEVLRGNKVEFEKIEGDARVLEDLLELLSISQGSGRL